MESVNAGIVRGAGWSVLLRIVDRGLGLVSTVVLARLLVPADFGIVALATSLLELLALLGAFGLELALIQNPRAERRHFDTVWTFNVLFGLGLALLLVLLAAPAARFYDEPRLLHVIFGLALARAIAGLQNVGVIQFQKEMAFSRDFRFRLYRRLATTFVVTLPLAFILRNHWALVGGMIAGSCFGVGLSYAMHPYRPRLSLLAWRELFGISKWLQYVQLVHVVSVRSSDFIVAKFAGLPALGSFSIAKEIAQLPTAELTAAIHGGVFPGYAKIASDPMLLRQTYLRVVAVLYLVTLPAGVGMALLAQPVVMIFLGDQWLAVVPLLQVLALNYVLTVTSRSASYVYLALGIPHRSATLATIRAGVALLAMLVLVPALGVQGAAYALLAGTVAAAPVNLRMLSRALGLTRREFVAVLWRPLLATLFMAATVTLLKASWSDTDTLRGSAVNFAATAAVGSAAFAGAILLLWRLASSPEGAESDVAARLKAIAAAGSGRFRSWLSA